jgi:hypothetical protein
MGAHEDRQADRTRKILERNVVLLKRQKMAAKYAKDPMKRIVLMEDIRKTNRFIRELEARLADLTGGSSSASTRSSSPRQRNA